MKEIALTKGYVALVDDADYGWLSEHKWQALINRKPNVTHVYAVRHERKDGRKRSVLMHRAIAVPLPGFLVDHINFNGLDNQRQNLRICTPSQNTANKRVLNNFYGIRGVQYRGGPLPWVGVVTKDGRAHRTPPLATPEEALSARDNLAVELHGAFAMTNSRLLEKNLPDLFVEDKSNHLASDAPCCVAVGVAP